MTQLGPHPSNFKDDLFEIYLSSENVGKHFIISSRSPGRTLLTTPSKSYVVSVVAFSNLCRILVEVFLESHIVIDICLTRFLGMKQVAWYGHLQPHFDVLLSTFIISIHSNDDMEDSRERDKQINVTKLYEF
ncbi:hypothetical protein H5410_055795 [Solanum commersonii]|uniref:Uncharacterized protein n=1 Tax=Solanum commersonii TaxID=4109 RepID=A0A9J5WJR8_SOLCO|nr:hypothetical protein H5410_055795 [Solanum commersonii]